MVVLRGRLEPEVGALFVQALAAAREALYQRARVPDGTGGPGNVSAGTSRRLACDASRVVMHHDDAGRLLEIGARTRTIPPALRRALHHRDRGCRFPGCGVRFAEGHHLRHWAHGGPTTLSNLALLCRRHHRAVHEEGYPVAREPDGALRFRRPDGRPLPEVPPPAPVPGDPVEVLRACHDSQGLRLTARTACAGWLGERLDLGWAIDVLHPRVSPRGRCRHPPGLRGRPAATVVHPARQREARSDRRENSRAPRARRR